jgi:Zn-dependent peptidase ImmA (M78 family)
MVHLLESRGVGVLSLSGCPREVDAFSSWHNDRPYVYLNTLKSSERSRMDAAHELAHLVLHRHQNKRRKDVEQEAKEFASAFLMPRHDVLAHARRRPSTATVVADKARWGVSAIAYVVRLHRMKLMTDWHYRQLCIHLSGKAEPNPMPREGSSLLASVLRQLRTEGVSRRQIARELTINPEDLEELLSGLVMTAVAGEGGPSGHDPEGEKPRLRLVQ